jgi:hypothetical protein
VAVGRTGLSTRGVGLSFDDRGNLYMSNVYPRVIYKLDPRTAAATAVGAQCQCVCGLAFDHGVMYGLGGDHSNNLVQVERSCGAITAIGPLQNVSLEIGGIDFDRHGVLWGIEQEGKLFTVNTASGVATVAASFGRGFKGIAIPPDRAPDCSRAVPSLETLWPPDHGLIGIDVLGVTDPDGDPVTLTIDRITQDEPVADGGTCPDAAITGSTAQLRAERSANGDGRIYLVSFTADDGLGGVSTGRVAVMVPHDQGKKSCTDTGLIYNSLESCSAALQGRAGDAASTAVRTIASAGSGATLEYSLAAEAEMQLAVYDVMGRRVAVVESGARSAGTHRATWNASGLPSGMYFAVLRAGDHVVRTPVILLK